MSIIIYQCYHNTKIYKYRIEYRNNIRYSYEDDENYVIYNNSIINIKKDLLEIKSNYENYDYYIMFDDDGFYGKLKKWLLEDLINKYD